MGRLRRIVGVSALVLSFVHATPLTFHKDIEPILQKIATDPNTMHINQVTARQLLKSIGSTLPSSPPASQP